MFAYMCIYKYVLLHTSANSGMSINGVRLSVSVLLYIYVCMHVCIHVCVAAHVRKLQIVLKRCVCVCMRVCVSVFVFICVCMYVYIRVCIAANRCEV